MLCESLTGKRFAYATQLKGVESPKTLHNKPLPEGFKVFWFKGTLKDDCESHVLPMGVGEKTMFVHLEEDEPIAWPADRAVSLTRLPRKWMTKHDIAPPTAASDKKSTSSRSQSPVIEKRQALKTVQIKARHLGTSRRKKK